MNMSSSKQSYSYLRESEDRFRNLVETSPDGVVLTDPAATILLANLHCAQLIQAEHPDNLMGRLATDLVAAEERLRLAAALRSVAQERKPHRGEYLLKKEDGGSFCSEIIVAPLWNPEGHLISYTLLLRDISAAKAAADEILKLSRAVEQSASPIVITDASSRVEYVNARFSQVTGYAAVDIIGQSLDVLQAAQLSPEAYQQLKRVLSAGLEWRGELRNRKADGEEFWCLETVSPIRDDTGRLLHFLVIQEDITERKIMEQILREQNWQLSEAFDNLQLSKMRMVQQEKLAGIGQLAAGVAHEINNPLGFVISNFSSLEKYLSRLRRVLESYHQLRAVAEDGADEKLKELATALRQLEKEMKIEFILEDLVDIFRESHEGLERVRKIIKNLRAFARIDADAKFDQYNLNEGLQETLLMARNEIKHCARVEEFYGDVPLIIAVSSEINQVWMNLLVNAAHAVQSRHGEKMGTIRIFTGIQEERVYCVIEDDGAGISPEHLNKLFNPFFTTKPVGQGTGLGLSISYDIIVNKHHGELTAENLSDGGARFRVWLPLMPPSRMEEAVNPDGV